jgi:hypothetical protein
MLLFNACTARCFGFVPRGELVFSNDQLPRLSDRVFVYDDNKGADLIAEARAGDPDAEAALRKISWGFIAEGLPLPKHLRAYVGDVLVCPTKSPRGSEGGNKYTYFLRNRSIALVMGVLTNDMRMHKRTAVTLIGMALRRWGVHITEDGIRKIISRTGDTKLG